MSKMDMKTADAIWDRYQAKIAEAQKNAGPKEFLEVCFKGIPDFPQLDEVMEFFEKHDPNYKFHNDIRVYFTSDFWKHLKQRVLLRDKKVCVRCGCKATQVHLRSHDKEVVRGNDEGKLASVCEICFNHLLKDEFGIRRTLEEQDRILAENPDPKRLVPIKIKTVIEDGKKIKAAVWPSNGMTEEGRVRWMEVLTAMGIKHIQHYDQIIPLRMLYSKEREATRRL